MERLFVEPHGLGLAAVGVDVVGGREEAQAQQFREAVRVQGAVRGDQRQRVADPVPGLAREGEIGGEIERPAPAAGGLDCKRHADRRGTRRRRGRGCAGPLGHGILVERPRLAVGRGDLGVDGRDAVEAVVPAVAFEALVGLE